MSSVHTTLSNEKLREEFSKLPKEVLGKLTEEMKAKRRAELEVEILRKEMEQYKRETERWKAETLERYEQAITRNKSVNYEQVLETEEWKRKKEKEMEETLAGRDEEIARLNEEIAHLQMLQKGGVFESFKAAERSLSEKCAEVESLREQIDHLQLLTHASDPDKPRRHTISISHWNQMRDQVNLKKSSVNSSKMKSKAELIQLEIASIVIQQKQLEIVVQDGEAAKKRLEDLEKNLAQKRKDLTDVMKDIKSAKIVKEKQKQRENEAENALSLLAEPLRRSQILQEVEKHLIAPGNASVEIASLKGPTPTPLGTPTAFGNSVSLYPLRADGERQGEPIADRFLLLDFRDWTIAAVADGCGWGANPAEAARRASVTFGDDLKTSREEFSNSRHVAKLLLRAFRSAHSSIVADCSAENLFSAGTTTMLGSVTLPLAGSVGHHRWIFVCASVGDCKAFHYSARDRRVTEITVGNRQNLNDPRDPGGRIGPQLQDGSPDLRNLAAYSHLCAEDDLLMLFSDGVHDNLDPQNMGKSPSDFNLASQDDTWDNVQDLAAGAQVKSDYACRLLETTIARVMTQTSQSHFPVRLIVDQLLDHALLMTQSSRDFMEDPDNLDKRVPPDMKRFPGKMDHATALVFQVGKKNSEI